MTLNKLIFKNFRNYSNLEVSFHPGNNIFIGENGMGKTNILEGIYLLGMMKSFRSVLDKDLINWESDSFFIKGLFEDSDSESNISIGVHNGKKEVCYNDSVFSKLTKLIGTLKLVFFCQEDMSLILGSPADRRKYLDITLSLADPRYIELLINYRKALRQRNSALKSTAETNPSTDLVSVWDHQLVEYGSDILKIRKEFFDPINELTKQYYNSLNFEISDFHLSYQFSIGKVNGIDSIKDQYYSKLKENRPREIRYKQTLYGPHKDDFFIRNGDVVFKKFASQGQCRAGALTLKLAMTKYLEQSTQEKMILLMDDILLDLDNKKKESFLELVDGRQNFFTSTSLHGFDQIKRNSKIYNILDSKIELVSSL